MPAGMATLLRIDAHTAFLLWVKVTAMLFLCVFIPAYWRDYGPINFLWLSNIGLFGAVLALWLESRPLASMMLLATFMPDELGWDVDFLPGWLVGWRPLGATNYMFDECILAFIRSLSLVHPVVPALLAWMVYMNRDVGSDLAIQQ